MLLNMEGLIKIDDPLELVEWDFNFFLSNWLYISGSQITTATSARPTAPITTATMPTTAGPLLGNFKK